jgi:hypothetical protein
MNSRIVPGRLFGPLKHRHVAAVLKDTDINQLWDLAIFISSLRAPGKNDGEWK